jgi:hypothetical protein
MAMPLGPGGNRVRCASPDAKMERIRGFMRSHKMPLSGECSCHITPTAAMVDEFVKTIHNTTTQLLASNYGTN